MSGFANNSAESSHVQSNFALHSNFHPNEVFLGSNLTEQ
jgi:hypothetical protein